MKKKADKATLVYAGVIVVLIGIFIGLFVYGLNSVLSMEGSYPPHTVTEGIEKAPGTSAEGVEFLDKRIDEALKGKPAFSSDTSFSLGDVETDNEKLNEIISYVEDEFEEALEAGFDNIERTYGQGFNDAIMMPHLEPDDVDEVTTDYIYYTCPSCGETSTEPLESCEPCGGANPYYLTYKDNYEVNMKVNSSALEKTFKPLKKNEAIALLGDEFKGILKIDDYVISYNELDVFFKSDRLTNKLSYLEYRKDMTVFTTVTFKGEYASLGTVDVKLNLEQKSCFNFTWPGLQLNTHEMSIEPKASDNLLATLICDEPTAYTVTWESSDPDICSVDEEGYLKAGKEPGKATITAKYEFNGVEYSDSCLVDVKISVESLSINKRKISLNQGETFALVTTTDPKDATVTSVTWYTEDEKIATVDSDGVVTAVAAGQVTVYALSDDGYYKSSCEVTVK